MFGFGSVQPDRPAFPINAGFDKIESDSRDASGVKATDVHVAGIRFNRNKPCARKQFPPESDSITGICTQIDHLTVVARKFILQNGSIFPTESGLFDAIEDPNFRAGNKTESSFPENAGERSIFGRARANGAFDATTGHKRERSMRRCPDTTKTRCRMTAAYPPA